jgi:nitrate/nitrite transport system substrate-binding protein
VRKERYPCFQRILPTLCDPSPSLQRRAAPEPDAPLGQIAKAKPDAWYHGIAKSICRPDIYLAATKTLLDEGHVAQADFAWKTDGHRAPASKFIDGMAYDDRAPGACLERFFIGLKDAQIVVGNAIEG